MVDKKDAAGGDLKVVDDDILIEIVDGDEPVTEPVEEKADVKLDTAKGDTSPQAGVEDLKKQLAESERARRAEADGRRQADQRAATAMSTVDKSRFEAVNAYEVSAKQALLAGQNALKSAKVAFKTAMDASDFEAAADAQATIADATSNIKGAEYQLAQVDAVKKQLTTQAEQQAQQASQQVVPAHSRSADWIKAHPQFNERGALYNRAMAAHHKALEDGVTLESDAYFDRLNKAVDPNNKETEVTTQQTKQAARPTAGATAASPTRSGGGTTENQTPQKIRLTPAQVEAAAISGLTPAAYAKHMLALQAEGKIGRSN